MFEALSHPINVEEILRKRKTLKEELLAFVTEKLKKNSYATGKKPYHIYQRSDWGRKDKITLVPFKDIEILKDVIRLDK